MAYEIANAVVLSLMPIVSSACAEEPAASDGTRLLADARYDGCCDPRVVPAHAGSVLYAPGSFEYDLYGLRIDREQDVVLLVAVICDRAPGRSTSVARSTLLTNWRRVAL